MDLSVVVLSWNTAPLTVRALRSVADAAGSLPAQAFCVDNASTDDTVEQVRAALPEVRLVENETNLGFAAGNNCALPLLDGRYTCFLNSDCEAGPGSLAHVVRWLDRHEDVGVAAPRLVGADGRAQKAARPEPTLLGLLHRHTVLRLTPIGRRAARAWRRVPETTVPSRVDSVMGSCLVIRTDLLRRLGGFDEGYPFYWEDVDLCRRARLAGAGVAFIPDGPAVLHEGGAATAVAGGPPRLSFVQGLLRYVASREPVSRSRAFAYVFLVGLFARALLEVPLLGLRGTSRRLRGRPEAARRTWRTAAGWVTLLERRSQDLVRLLGVGR